MSTNVTVIPTRINKTAAAWAADSTVYSANKLLFSTDVFYTGTNQMRYKIANGVNVWSALDYVPAGAVDTTMATANTTQDADRTHTRANFNSSYTNGRSDHWQYNSTAPGSIGNFQITAGGTTIGDKVFQITTGLGDAVEVYGNRSTYFRGDAFFSANAYMSSLINPFFTGTNIGLGNGIIASSVGFRPGYYTTSDRVAISPATFEGMILYDAGLKELYLANGTIWLSLGKPISVTTAQRTALSNSDYARVTVFDTDTDTYWFSDGTNWIEI